MYGGPGGYGPGPGGPHGPHGCHCHGPYGHGPFPPPYPWGPAPIHKKKNNAVDYMPSLDFDGPGKKFYSACACEFCSKPFELDYRLADNVTFISTSDMGYYNGEFYSDYKFKGYFKFNIGCPECKKDTVFFVDVRKLPKFVLDYYLKHTIEVDYAINYRENNENTKVHVAYMTNGTNVKEVHEKINSGYLEKMFYSKGTVDTDLGRINKAIAEEYTKVFGKKIEFDEKSIYESNTKKNKKANGLRVFKYLLLNNGIGSLLNYNEKNNEYKEEVKILSK